MIKPTKPPKKKRCKACKCYFTPEKQMQSAGPVDLINNQKEIDS